MKRTKAVILLISAGDTRQRYNYVVVPLKAAGAKVEIHAGLGISWLVSLGRKARQLARLSDVQTAVVISIHFRLITFLADVLVYPLCWVRGKSGVLVQGTRSCQP